MGKQCGLVLEVRDLLVKPGTGGDSCPFYPGVLLIADYQRKRTFAKPRLGPLHLVVIFALTPGDSKAPRHQGTQAGHPRALGAPGHPWGTQSTHVTQRTQSTQGTRAPRTQHTQGHLGHAGSITPDGTVLQASNPHAVSLPSKQPHATKS